MVQRSAPQPGSAMNVPKNVWWFEVLLYASLLVDAVNVAFQDRTPGPGMTEQAISPNTFFSLALLPLLFYCIWLAARRRKSWPRFALSALLALSVIALPQVIAERGVEFDVFLEIVSEMLAGCGLYFSFTGDAKGWFDA